MRTARGFLFGLVMIAGLAAVGASAQIAPQTAPEAASVAPDPMASAFQAYLLGLRSQANAAGVSNATFDRIVPTLRYNPRVISLDRAQPGGDPTRPAPIPNFAPYKARHVDADRINRGRVRYQALRPQLARVERETGVPESIMMAIYGHETGYGSYTGNFDLLGSLATLAFEGRRRELFTGELIAAMLLVERGVSRDQLKGSWAGATGLPQFLPSVYLRLARDGDGDGRADIWSSEADALASIGNYLVNAGWKPNIPWGVAARVPAGLDRAALTSRIVSPRCPRVHARHSKWKTIREWRTLGIQIMGGNVPADSEMASLLEPDGPGATAYLLTGNYRVILDYNCSNFYGLSVGLLADAIVG